MAPTLEDEFYAALERSRLLATEQLESARALIFAKSANKSQKPCGFTKTLQRLADNSLLTPWQIEMLRAGKCGFFLGRFKLINFLGCGGSGHVFQARDTKLGRDVAIKVMASGLVKNRNAVARFHKEVQASARLNHPNIVMAYDAESEGDNHFLVMEYVPGINLGEMLEFLGPLSVGWACHFALAAAIGLQHAFEQGMVHRDIKPTNLLATPADGNQLNIKILDLGLARFTNETTADGGLTHSGQVLGTPDYISPEQAADTRSADIRSDLFSLGCTLYRLLSGELPFGGRNVMEKLMARATQTAPPLRQFRSDIPVELERIVMRLLERDPARRFQSPAELAAALLPYAKPTGTDPLTLVARQKAEAAKISDVPAQSVRDADTGLEQFLDGLSTAASRSSESLHRQKPFSLNDLEPKTRRTLALSALTVFILTGIALAASLGWTNWSQPTVTIDWPESERGGGKLIVGEASLAVPAHGPIVVSRPAGPHKVRAERQGFAAVEKTLTWSRSEPLEWRPEWRPTVESARQRDLRELTRIVTEAGDSAPLEHLSTTGQARALEFIRQNQGTSSARKVARLLKQLAWPIDLLDAKDIAPAELRAISPFSSPPPELVAVLGDSRFRAWNTVRQVTCADDGKWIASAGDDGALWIWETSTGRAAVAVPVVSSQIEMKFVPGKALLLYISGDELQALRPQDGQVEFSLREAAGPLAVASSGDFLACAGLHRIRLLDAQAGLEVGEISCGERTIVSLQFSGDGTQILAGFADNSAELWDWKRNNRLWQATDLERLVLSPQGPWLAAGLTGGVNRNNSALWRLPEPEPEFLLPEAGEPMSFLNESRTVATRRLDRVILWDVTTGTEQQTFRDIPELDIITANGQWLVGADADFGGLTFIGLQSGSTERVQRHRGGVTRLCASGDSTLVVSGSSDHSLKLWDPAHATERVLSGHAVGPVDISPDGRVLALFTGVGNLQLWDIATRTTGRTLVDDAQVARALRFSPNGRFLACVGDWGFFQYTLRLWDTASTDEVSIQDGGSVRAFAFSPDSQTLATVSGLRTIATWKLPGMSTLQSIDLPADVTDVAFSHDGERLLIACRDGALLSWNLGEDEPGSIAAVNSEPTALVVHPYTDVAALATSDGRLVMCDLRARKVRGQVSMEAAPASAVTFSPDGDLLAISNQAGYVRVYDVINPFVPVLQGEFELGPPGGLISQVRFSPDGRHLLTADGNGTVAVLRLGERMRLTE